MLKKSIGIFFILIMTCILSAEDSNSKHSISLNFGGPQSLGYAEYQYQILQSNKSSLSLSLGVGIFTNITAPLGLEYSYGTKRNKLILGGYYVPEFNVVDPSNDIYLNQASLRFGYRRYFRGRNKHIFLQLYLTPILIFYESRVGITESVGLGFGVNL